MSSVLAGLSGIGKQDNVELVLSCDLLVGVGGGVMEVLACLLPRYLPLVAESGRQLGESGGVDKWAVDDGRV